MQLFVLRLALESCLVRNNGNAKVYNAIHRRAFDVCRESVSILHQPVANLTEGEVAEKPIGNSVWNNPRCFIQRRSFDYDSGE